MPVLDRFEVGLVDVQQVPVVNHCENCDSDIYLGDSVIEYEMDYFCDRNCLAEYLLENVDFTEVEA